MSRFGREKGLRRHRSLPRWSYLAFVKVGGVIKFRHELGT